MKLKTCESLWVYDIESYPNFASISMVDLFSDKKFVFEISERKNQWSIFLKMVAWMRANKEEMIGFNNLMYDWVVLEECLKMQPSKVNAEVIRVISDRLILGDIVGKDENGFIRERKSPWENVVWNQAVKQWDIYLIAHFNNKARRTSLKQIEFFLRKKNIMDSPYPFDQPVPLDGFDSVLEYNMNDALDTKDFIHLEMGALMLRDELMSGGMKQNLRCANNGKIGQHIFVDLLGWDNCYETTHQGKVPKQTHRESVIAKDIIYEEIDFVIPEFRAIHRFFNEQIIVGTRDVFAMTDETAPDYIKDYMGRVFTKTMLNKIEAVKIYDDTGGRMDSSLYPRGTYAFIKRLNSGAVTEADNVQGQIKKLNVQHGGIQYDFGVGGLHACRKGSFYSSEDRVIIDWDFTAWYPSLGRFTGAHPEHLPEEAWTKANEEIWNRRQSFVKGTSGYAAYKEAGNLPYGQSGDQHSPFFDQQYMLTICINGQLLLLMLIEQTLTSLTNVTVIQANTDGLTFEMNRDEVHLLYAIKAEFEAFGKGILLIEEAEYAEIHMRDVNNYIAKDIGGYIKRKGVYEIEKAVHKNGSMAIVAKAVDAYLFEGVEIEDFIYSHTDPFDFYKMVKRVGRDVLTFDGTPLTERVVRYYCSTGGGELVKQTAKSKMRMEGKTGVTMAQLVDGTMPDDVNYDYYINEAVKLLRFQEE